MLGRSIFFEFLKLKEFNDCVKLIYIFFIDMIVSFSV